MLSSALLGVSHEPLRFEARWGGRRKQGCSQASTMGKMERPLQDLNLRPTA